jgi:hypothetical protein
MATWRTVLAPEKALEDPLLHLPCSNIVDFKKGQMIYSQDQPSRTVSQALSIWGTLVQNRLLQSEIRGVPSYN